MHSDRSPVASASKLLPADVRRVARFVIVGTVAAAVHWCLVVFLVSQWSLKPAIANVPAWLVAFVVSFAGHRHWTFVDQGPVLGRSARRFFIVSAAGFAVNESAYTALLHWTRWPYQLVLVGVLVAVAVLTYLASRHWAFLHSPAR